MLIYLIRKRMANIAIAASAFIVSLSLSSQAFAKMEVMSVENLAQASTHVVKGKCESMESHWNKDQSYIYTAMTFSIEEVVAGKKTEEKVTVYVPGGEVDGKRQIVVGGPEFSVGESAVLFLNKIDPGNFNITSLSQGKLNMEVSKASGDLRLNSAAIRFFTDDESYTSALKNNPLHTPEGMSMKEFREVVQQYIR